MASRKLGKLATKNTALFLCDMQEKFRKTIKFYPQVISVANRLLETATILDLPVIVTEQYPKGLGPTVSELNVSKYKVFPKDKFSMDLPEVHEELKKHGEVNTVILCGIECHVCILQTTLDLLEDNFNVHVVADACSSRSMVDRMFALQRMREAGAFITTSESVILGLAAGSDHPKFRSLQKIIWDEAPESGLLTHKITGSN